MLLVTTCRKPCTNTRIFARMLGNLVPDAEYAPRGKKNIYGLIDTARQKGLRRIAVISDFRGNPGKMEFLKLDRNQWDWADTIFRIKGIVLKKDKQKIKDIRVEGKLKETALDLFDITESDEPEIVLEIDEDKMTLGDKINIKLEVYKSSEE